MINYKYVDHPEDQRVPSLGELLQGKVPVKKANIRKSEH